MRKIHFTDKYLLSPYHPVTVLVAGAGGTGYQVITSLARMSVALQALGHPGLHLTAFDPDTVTEANIGRQLFSEQHDRMTPGSTTNSVVCIAVNETEPPMAFTPTISTEAPHIIQEGQPITDRVTVGVKSGDHWINGTSVTAKGYYFTGSKDAIIRGISPNDGINSDADIASYPGRVRSGG